MLHILWVILKIIGIVLLVLLAVILVLLILVLFVPIKYKVTGEVNEETKAKGVVSWLFHLVSISFRYETKRIKVFFRILGIPFSIPITQEEKEKKEKKKNKKKRNKKRRVKSIKTRKEKKPKNESRAEEQHNNLTSGDSLVKKNEQEKEEIFRRSKVNNLEEANKGTSGRERKKSFWTSIIEKIKKLKYTVKNICDKIKDIKGTWKEIGIAWKEERVKLAIKKIKSQVLYFLKYCKPKKFKIHLHFGMEDPATTGQILGGISIFYPIFRKNISIVPNFEQEILEGTLLAKGRIQIFVVVKILFRLYRDKNIKYALGRLQNVKENKKFI